jgi:hypothetical protein
MRLVSTVSSTAVSSTRPGISTPSPPHSTTPVGRGSRPPLRTPEASDPARTPRSAAGAEALEPRPICRVSSLVRRKRPRSRRPPPSASWARVLRAEAQKVRADFMHLIVAQEHLPVHRVRAAPADAVMRQIFKRQPPQMAQLFPGIGHRPASARSANRGSSCRSNSPSTRRCACLMGMRVESVSPRR